MTLRDDIAAWDAKAVEPIVHAYDQYAEHEGFLAELADLMQEVELQRGASWLLKHHFDEGGEAQDEAYSRRIYSLSKSFADWETRLHILQCMPKLPIPARSRAVVERFVRNCLADEAKFVRAWAFTGLWELAARFPQYRMEAVQLFEAALTEEPAASVKARVRRVMKQPFPE